MIAVPGVQQTLWQSPDGLIAAGSAEAGGLPYHYINLGPREIGCADIQGVSLALSAAKPNAPLLLLSCCPGFVVSSSEEAQGMVFYAGAYRALLQQRKASGGLILSYTAQILVGGIYLMQGLCAQHRAAAEGTRFYDTLPNHPPVPLAQAQARGLLDEIISPKSLESWLLARLA
jgi:hypothetical protein